MCRLIQQLRLTFMVVNNQYQFIKFQSFYYFVKSFQFLSTSQFYILIFHSKNYPSKLLKFKKQQNQRVNKIKNTTNDLGSKIQKSVTCQFIYGKEQQNCLKNINKSVKLSYIFPFLEEQINQQQILKMQVRSLSRNNTITSLNKKLTAKLQPKPASTKKVLEAKDMNKPQLIKQKFVYEEHPASYLLRGTNATTAEFKKFTTLLYRGLYYAVNNLKGPSEEYLKKKKVKLPQPQDSKQKFLILDLDQTLIHSVFTNEKTDIKFTFKGDEFKFNMRPNCLQFLQSMSQLYNVYVFTAGTQDYAQPIVNYLNQKKKTILGVLHRKNCMQTHNGFFIKDLRIISNRQLKDIVIIDNLVHSFGLQLDNGIPILQYLSGKSDREFEGLETILREIVDVDDVRTYIKDKINVRKALEINQTDFITIQTFKSKS